LVLQFYNERRRNIREAKPNNAHLEIAKLEDVFDIEIITQNIDDLHERAGSSNVLHLHGEIFKMRSDRNSEFIYPIRNDMHLGDSAEDGAQQRPHIVWFGEEVPMMEPAIQKAMKADVFIVIGTSLVVYPAASLIQYVPSHAEVIVIDTRLPEVNRHHVTYIEKPATEGVAQLRRLLL
jgi:NAD-dependent deacetylase